MQTTMDRLRSRADRFELEAQCLRRLAKDLDFQEKNVAAGGFRLHEDSKKALWNLAKL